MGVKKTVVYRNVFLTTAMQTRDVDYSDNVLSDEQQDSIQQIQNFFRSGGTVLNKKSVHFDFGKLNVNLLPPEARHSGRTSI